MIEALNDHGVAPIAGSVESSSLALNFTLLQSGDFVSILPPSVARQHVLRGTMRVLPLASLEPLGEVITYWRADVAAPAAQFSTECLREVSRELLGD